tara:strand:+ start:1487 stop:2548 length:1062 start_codon:yes stop_codon:yes gene_type:complete
MSLKKENKSNNEVDLIEIFLIILNYKWTISFCIAFSLAAMFLYLISQPLEKQIYKARTEIKPISTFEEFEYESYNSYLQNTDYDNVFYSFNPFKDDLEKSTSQKAFVFKDIDFYNNTDNSSFKKINKKYLLNLFVDKLRENLIFTDAIKKFELIKREDYESNQAYENAIVKLSHLIKINIESNEAENNSNNQNSNSFNFYIEYATYDKNKWQKVLLFIEDTANKEIQKYLNETFNRLILNQERLRSYKVEDIDILISNSEDKNKEIYLNHLKTLRSDILENRNIKRLQNEFKSTPIINSNKFYAAKIMVKSTSFQGSTNKKHQTIPMLIFAGLLGAFFGISYALMSNSVKKRL